MYNKGFVFTAACIGMLLFGIVMLSLGTINTFLTEKFALDELTVGSLAVLLPFGILAGSLVFGPIVDRYGYKSLLIICTIIIAICIEAMAFTSSFFVIQISFFLIGVVGGAINGGTNALVADISQESKGAKLSLLGMFFGIGALGMPAITAFLASFFSYETIITGIGVAVLIPTIFFISIKFPAPKQTQGFPIKQSMKLIKDSTLILIGFFLFFESAVEGVINNWSTTYMQKELHFIASDSLYALSIMVVALTIARLILGGLLLRISSKIVLYFSMVLIFSGLIVLYFSSSYLSAVSGLVLIGMGFGAGFPVMLGYVGELYADLSGTAFSIVLVIALVGNMSVNSLVAKVAHVYGIHHYLTILIICVIIMTIILAIILRKISTKINFK